MPTGSPPRLWGKHRLLVFNERNSRFTPTPVGKTHPRRRSSRYIPVHPHACGENVRALHGVTPNSGSPPRLWGKHGRSAGRFQRIRFTPTPVGKTRDPSSPYTRKYGSPPRLWGKLAGARNDGESARFTPTPVGKTPPSLASKSASAVHPHACGENPELRRGNQAVIGSPPRLWGKRHCDTPYAISNAVHPHACGENQGSSQCAGCSGRFTPTPVGKTTPCQAVWQCARFTPTPVGKTGAGRIPFGLQAVHPHACGENAGSSRQWALCISVHPHACGENQLRRINSIQPNRFTPTPVGKTPSIRQNLAA